jgi:hypothetical protein
MRYNSSKFNEGKGKTFKIVTKNGRMLFFNPIVEEQDGVLSIDKYSFKLDEVRKFSYDKKTEVIEIVLFGEKVEESTINTQDIRDYMSRLAW